MSKRQSGSLAATLDAALDAVRAGAPDAPIAVAYSGGIDSTVLLHLAHGYATKHKVALQAFHIHHGLSAHADAWRSHCASTCAALGVPFEARSVLVNGNKSGVELAARKSRYAALGALCDEHGIRLMLTGHHLDDQAETVLLQLLRGSGAAGLSGMDVANAAPDLLGNPDLVMARPLLSVLRADLQVYLDAHGLTHIDDESNTDPRFTRNALRLTVMPALAQRFPGYQERFARSALHAQSAQRLLSELAVQDLSACLDGDCIDVEKLRQMSLDRSYNMLRHWFGTRGLAMPSTAWLHEMVTQLVEARHDAQLCVTHPDCHIRRYRDRLHITPKLAELAGARDKDDLVVTPGLTFRWQGEASIAFPAYGGVLYFDPVAAAVDGQGWPELGIDTDWLRAQSLTIEFRKGGERLKLAANRPTRSLKSHYQGCDVPAWERARLPVVSAGTQLLFAAGIGMDCHHLSGPPAARIRFRWQS